MKNLFGELVFDEETLANEVLDEYSNYARFTISPVPGRKTAFNAESVIKFAGVSDRSVFRRQGLYFVYGPDKKLFHVGSASGTNTIQTRVGRMVKEILGLSRIDENHPAGRKWRHYYGRNNFDGMEVVPVPLNFHGLNPKKVERYVINTFQPIAHRDYHL